VKFWKGYVAMGVFFVGCVLVTVTMVSRIVSVGTKPSETLGDRIVAACVPLIVSDWQTDYVDPTVVRVTCYDPKTSLLTVKAVER
jgi:hypothetical protein